jgi:hypothetical protein
MSYINEHKVKFENLKLNMKNQDSLRREANGGNSIIFSYPPSEEHLYLKKAQEEFSDIANFIDISKLLVKYIDSFNSWDRLERILSRFKTNIHKIFHDNKSPDTDLFDLIINEIFLKTCFYFRDFFTYFFKNTV